MDNQETRFNETSLTDDGDVAVVEYLKQAINDGKHWYIALLEAIGLWHGTGETRDYLIDGEALDWLRLAERLCHAVDGLLPDDEKDALLFRGKPPLRLGKEGFKRLIGEGKYQQCLNYFYGVVVEEALVLAVQDEVRKEKRTMGYANEGDTTNETYRRIYGSTRAVLFARFQREKHYPRHHSMSLNTLHEFTYWLFKYRLNNCDKTRVASDTKRALKQLGLMDFSPPW
ncbi:hypothetical protein ACFLYF_04325 [Chloroflexota bacterium]